MKFATSIFFTLLCIGLTYIDVQAVEVISPIQLISYGDPGDQCGISNLEPYPGFDPTEIFMHFTFSVNVVASEITYPVDLQDTFSFILKDAYGNFLSSQYMAVNALQSIDEVETVSFFFGNVGYFEPAPDEMYPTMPHANTTTHISRPWIVEIAEGGGIGNFGYIAYPLTSIASFIFDPADYIPACDRLPYIGVQNSTQLNQGNSENEVAVYNATDDSGEPALHIYDINPEGNGILALEITQEIIAPFINNPPSENTELMTSDNGKVTLYILDTGELQINNGPDEEGKIHVLIFDGIPPTNIYGYVIDPPMFP